MMNSFDKIPISGWSFSSARNQNISPFEKLFEIFKELITYTSGDFDEAIDWLKELDKEYELTTDDYTIDDFINDLLNKGFVKAEFDVGSGKESKKISPYFARKTNFIILEGGESLGILVNYSELCFWIANKY